MKREQLAEIPASLSLPEAAKIQLLSPVPHWYVHLVNETPFESIVGEGFTKGADSAIKIGRGKL
jgi:hypothetical protein